MQLPLDPQMSRSAAASMPHKRLELDPPGVGEQPNLALTSSTTQQAGLFSPGPLPGLLPESCWRAVVARGRIAAMLIATRTNNVILHMAASSELMYQYYAPNQINCNSQTERVNGRKECRRCSASRIVVYPRAPPPLSHNSPDLAPPGSGLGWIGTHR